MCGYLQRLVGALGHRHDHDAGRLAEVEQRRAHEVADVLDQHDRTGRRIEGLEAAGQHVRVEVAAAPGVDLHDAGAGGADPLGVEQRLLVALDDRQLPLAAEAPGWSARAAWSSRAG